MVAPRGIEQLITEIELLRGLDERARTLIAGCSMNEHFRADEYIFREGRPADKFYLIRHGTVVLEVYVPGRDPIILESLRAGEVLGWSWIAPPYCWTFDARASQRTRVISVDAKCLRGKCYQDPVFGYALYKAFIPVVAQRLHAARMRLIDMYGNVHG